MHARDQPLLVQAREKLLEVRPRNVLPAADVGGANRAFARAKRKLKHGGNGVATFGGEAHDPRARGAMPYCFSQLFGGEVSGIPTQPRRSACRPMYSGTSTSRSASSKACSRASSPTGKSRSSKAARR